MNSFSFPELWTANDKTNHRLRLHRNNGPASHAIGKHLFSERAKQQTAKPKMNSDFMAVQTEDIVQIKSPLFMNLVTCEKLKRPGQDYHKLIGEKFSVVCYFASVCVRVLYAVWPHFCHGIDFISILLYTAKHTFMLMHSFSKVFSLMYVFV